MQVLTENWIVAVIALVIAAILAWWLLAANRKTAITREAPDADESPPRRNQALIDAAPAAALPPATPEGLAGVGAAVSAAADPARQEGDDLRRIKGLGPKVERLLRDMGITSFAQIAAWDDAEIDRIDAGLGQFAGRIRRDDWPTQARLLAAGDLESYQATFGKL